MSEGPEFLTVYVIKKYGRRLPETTLSRVVADKARLRGWEVQETIYQQCAINEEGDHGE